MRQKLYDRHQQRLEERRQYLQQLSRAAALGLPYVQLTKPSTSNITAEQWARMAPLQRSRALQQVARQNISNSRSALPPYKLHVLQDNKSIGGGGDPAANSKV